MKRKATEKIYNTYVCQRTGILKHNEFLPISNKKKITKILKNGKNLNKHLTKED